MSATSTNITSHQFLPGQTQWTQDKPILPGQTQWPVAPEKPILPGQTQWQPSKPILPGQTSWIDITVTPGHPDMSRGARIYRAAKYFVILVLHLALRFYAGYLAYECNAGLGPATQWFFTILAFLFPIIYLIFYGVYHKLFGVQCPTGVSTTIGQPLDISGVPSVEAAPVLGGLRKFKLRRH
jgi:hypothetical protein